MLFTEHKNHLFEALFNYASMGIVIANASGDIVLVNPFGQKQFGYTAEEMIGQKVELLIPKHLHKKHLGHREGYVRNPQERPMGVGMDLFAVRKDGTEFPVEVSLAHYVNNQDRFVIAFISDITIRKQNEDEIKHLNEVLEEKVEERTLQLTETLKKLESWQQELIQSLEKEKNLGELKSRFVTMASHEFRTPLSTVLSSASLLEKYTTTDEQGKRKKHIERIISSVRMLTDILNDFLSVGKIEEGKVTINPKLVNIRNYIQNTITEIKGILKKGQNVSYEHKGPADVILDPSLLRHIIMNLLSNAIKFSPEETQIFIKSERTKGLLQLSIKDRGIGMSKEDQQHLFERFHRGSNVTNIQGTGLGLHIMSKYAELMNGKIKCRSELGKGTEFIIKFDMTDVEAGSYEIS